MSAERVVRLQSPPQGYRSWNLRFNRFAQVFSIRKQSAWNAIRRIQLSNPLSENLFKDGQSLDAVNISEDCGVLTLLGLTSEHQIVASTVTAIVPRADCSRSCTAATDEFLNALTAMDQTEIFTHPRHVPPIGKN